MAEENLDRLNLIIKGQMVRSEELENAKTQLHETLKRQLEKKRVLDLEEQERRQHHNSLKHVYEMEQVRAKGGSGNDKQDGVTKEEEEKRAQQQVESKVFEKLNFHMDKYLTYIDLNIKHSVKRIELELDQNSYAPTPVTAIIIRCLKTNFINLSSSTVILGTEDDEAFITTFKVTKKHLMGDLKRTAILYWEHLLTAQDYQALADEANEDKFGGPGQVPLPQKSEDKQSQSYSRQSNSAQPLRRFELVDEQGPIVMLDTDAIDKYITSKQQGNTQDQPYLILTLRKKKTRRKGRQKEGETGTAAAGAGGEATSKQSGQQDSSKAEQIAEENDEEEEDVLDELDEKQKKYMSHDLYKAYVKLFQRLPLLRKYFIIEDEEVIIKDQINLKKQEIKKKGFTYDDNHCCMVSCMLLMLLFNSIFFLCMDNASVFASHISQLRQLLKIQATSDAPGQQPLTWLTISTISDLEDYLSDLQGMPYSLFETNSLLRQTYEIIGAIRIRQIRTKEIECPHPRRTNRISQVKCKYETLSSDTAYTELIEDGQQQWQVYQPIQNVGIPRTSTGLFGSYDASGYILDINKGNQTIKFYQGNVIGKVINSRKYFEIETLAQFLTFNLRSATDGTFIFIEFMLEYTSTGIFPTDPIIIPYSPNIYGTKSSTPFSTYGVCQDSPPKAPSEYGIGTILFALDILRIFMGIFFIILVLISAKNNDSGQGFNWRYFISITFVLNIAVIVTTFISIAKCMAHGNYGLKVEDLQNTTTYVDLGNVATLYNSVLVHAALNTCIIMVRLTMLLSFFKSFDAMIYTIEHSYLQLLASFIVLILVVFGFTFVAISIWGYYLDNFSNFGNAMLSLLLLSMGQLDLSTTLDRGLSLAIPFLGGYYLFIYQYMFGIIVVIYIDSYRMTIIDQGIQVDNQDAWTCRDLLTWLFNWCPQSWQDRIMCKNIRK